MNKRLSTSLLLGIVLAVSVFVAFALAGGSDGVALAQISSQPPVVGKITLDPPDREPLVEAEVDVSFTAVLTDPGILSTYTAAWRWGDLTTSECEFDSSPPDDVSSSGSNSEACKISATPVETGYRYLVEGTHSYTEPNVYSVGLTMTRADGVSVEFPKFEYLVVYNPEGGFVTGGGWIDSPVNVDYKYMQVGGKATFGFVSKYKKGAEVPEGNTEFQFKASDLNFHSTSYNWLVVAGHKAQYKGTGTINGAGNYGFMISAIDADLTPSSDVDKFRIKIWDKDAGDALIYDNQVACSEAGDDADPCTEIGGGSIVIHKGKGK